ncbi:uncharacterized protein LOC142975200 isoform X2 [Anticarsia gemmatalis]
MVLKEAKVCKGPKRKDCANTTILVTGKSSISCNLTVPETLNSIKVKILGWVDNKEVIKISVARMCDHIFFAPLMKVLVKMTDDCNITKGIYSFSLNLEDIMKNYHGASFMFGDWTYKALFYNDDCNFTCGIFQMVVNAKKKI